MGGSLLEYYMQGWDLKGYSLGIIGREGSQLGYNIQGWAEKSHSSGTTSRVGQGRVAAWVYYMQG